MGKEMLIKQLLDEQNEFSASVIDLIKVLDEKYPREERPEVVNDAVSMVAVKGLNLELTKLMITIS